MRPSRVSGHSRTLELAIYLYRQTFISGGDGRSAVASAAYRHSTSMTVEQSGRTADYRSKADTVHSEISIPPDAPAWIVAEMGLPKESSLPATHAPDEDRSLTGAAAVQASEVFWNRVELSERRGDAQYSGETTLALPIELTREQNVELVRSFVANQITSRGYVADWAYHLPEGREHNPHVHIMTSLRPLTQDGFGLKRSPMRDEHGDLLKSEAGKVRYRRFGCDKVELESWRRGWAEEVNHALARHGHDRTIDHRSLKDQGIHDIEAGVHRGSSEYLRQRGTENERAVKDEEARARNFARFERDPSLVLREITRQQSTFDDRAIARVIFRYAGENDDFQSLRLRVGALNELIPILAEIHDPTTNKVVQRARYTTVEVLDREAAMIEAVRSRAQDFSFGGREGLRKISLAKAENQQGFAFSPEQRGAIAHLTGEEGIAVMIGFAGAGKSTAMRGVRFVYEREKRSVYGAALSGKAADALEQSSGIASRTLASWEWAWAKGQDHLKPGDVFVLDEAAMVGSAQMSRLLVRLHDWGVKPILAGDDRQLASIGYGGAFTAVHNEVGAYELTDVRRQRIDWQVEASIDFGHGRSRQALDAYAAHDRIVFHDDRTAAHRAVVAGWARDWRAGADVTMMAYENRDVRALNALARDTLKSDGALTGGDRFVTERGVREFAPGDRVLFLENNRAMGVRNGTIGDVMAVGVQSLDIAVPGFDQPVRIRAEDYNNIDHAYATTIHKWQGGTVDQAHALATGLMGSQLAHVALTRQREDVVMHVARDTFANRWATELPSHVAVLDRLAKYQPKDTTLDHEASEDYQLGLRAIAERRAHEASLAGRFESFLERRGLPHPRDVLREVRETFAAGLFGRETAESIRVPEVMVRAVLIVPEVDDRIRPLLNRLAHVQGHSAAMNHEGNARRDAFNAAENAFERSSVARPFTAYAEAVQEIVPATTVVAIGPELSEAAAERHLAHLPEATRASLQANWQDVHTVSRAGWELGLCETAHALAGGYRWERDDLRIEAEYQAGLDAHLLSRNDRASDGRLAARTPATGLEVDTPAHRGAAPELAAAVTERDREPFLPALTQFPLSFDEAVDRRLRHDHRLASYRDRFFGYAEKIWSDPQDAMRKIYERLDRGDGKVAHDVTENPAMFGALLGGRTLLLKPNAEREAALRGRHVLSSSIRDHVNFVDRARHRYTHQETAWREIVRDPLPPLSPRAASLVETLVSAAEIERRGDYKTARTMTVEALRDHAAWAEVKDWREGLKGRVDGHEANLGDLPGFDRSRVADVVATASRTEIAHKEGEVTLKVERHLEQQRAYEREHGHEEGYGYER
ncbi:Ti-type conjugative transfer relaxase TraA [Aurantimonas sp. C2-6-R+9]|uniref:Ti-type conjugative transfer relaxase TraA n=1 Tax=Aurantimonas sp. C2-6-R+9 TaxID=3114365 RepID=UPI002E181EE9|nr:Ti-type conjugative transfer relaxase TraA [Aurantimonas sp. C2-6-R+9]